MPDAVNSSGTDVHRPTLATTSGSSTMTRARSGLPPLLSATTAAMSAATPEPTSQRTSSSLGTGGNGISTHRLATVTKFGDDLVGQQDEHGVSRRLLERLQQGRRTQGGEMDVEDDNDLARRVQRSPLGQRDDLSDVGDGDGRPAPADNVQIRIRPGQRSPAGGAFATPAVGAQQRGGKSVRSGKTSVASRAAEQVRVDRVGRGRPQRGHRSILSHDAGEE